MAKAKPVIVRYDRDWMAVNGQIIPAGSTFEAASAEAAARDYPGAAVVTDADQTDAALAEAAADTKD